MREHIFKFIYIFARTVPQFVVSNTLTHCSVFVCFHELILKFEFQIMQWYCNNSTTTLRNATNPVIGDNLF